MPFILAWLASLVEPEPELAQRIAAGDAAALRRLYDRLAGRVRALGLRVLGNPSDADDVVQDTFVEVWNCAAQFDPERGALSTWVTTIAHRRAVDRLRRRGTRPIASPDSPEAPGWMEEHLAAQPGAQTAEIVSPEDVAGQRQARERVVRALAALPKEQRQAIELMYFGGLSQSEAAAQLGQALGTFKSRVRAGMLQLEGLLSELSEGGAR